MNQGITFVKMSKNKSFVSVCLMSKNKSFLLLSVSLSLFMLLFNGPKTAAGRSQDGIKGCIHNKIQLSMSQYFSAPIYLVFQSVQILRDDEYH